MPPKQCILPVALLALLLQSTLSVDATVSSPTQPAPSDTTDVVTSQPWSTLSDTTDVVTSQPWSTLSDTTDVITSQSWPTPSDTTVVVGSRPSRLEELRLGSSFATRIVVADERGPAEGMADLLERSVGLAIRRYGGPGSIATLSVRGMDPGEVEIFLDHVPLRTASQGMVDLSTIDLAQVESIEIYRSAPPADLGGEVAGAAVRLITRSGGPRHQLGLHSSAGSYGTWTLEAFASGSFKENRYILGAARFRTEGDFLYFNDNGTEHNATDDSWEHWTNGDVLRESLFTRLSRTFRSVGSFDWSSQFWHSDQGLPGTNHQPTHESRLWMRGALHRAEWTAEKHLGGALRIHLYGSLGNEDRHYRDPLRELAVPGASALRADQEQERAGGGLHLAWTLCSISRPWLGIHRFEVLGESRRELLRNLPLPGRSEEDRRRRESGVFSIGECIEVMDDRLRFDLFYRWDRSRDNYTGVNPYRPFEPCPKHTSEYRGPRLGLRARLGQGLILKANYARQARFPTFAELFGYGGAIHSNPTLMPEQSRRMDLGWVWNAPIQPLGMKLHAENAFYTSELDEMIVLIRISERETKPYNLDKARIDGCEFTLMLDHIPILRSLDFLPRLESAAARIIGLGPREGQMGNPASDGINASLSGSGTPSLSGSGTPLQRDMLDARFSGHLAWQRSRDESISPVYYGKELTYHPPLRAGLRLDLIQGRWTLSYCARYQAACYWSRSNLPEYKSKEQWNHEVQARLCLKRPSMVLSLRVDNLLDEQQEDIRGYSLPGRSWFGGIELARTSLPGPHREGM